MPESQLLDGDQIKIGKQIVLPLTKAIEISLKSLKTRFWRSMITMGGIILAIAFLTTILATNAIVTALKDAVVAMRQTDPARAARLQQVLLDKGYEIPEAEEEAQAGGGGNEAESSAAGMRAKSLSKRDAKDIWLVTLALFVSFVGIMNSMLMSVTERFREIGTMKCLGALDSFIVKLFLIESFFQGVVGTCIGIMAGMLVTLAQMSFAFGPSIALPNLPPLGLLIIGGEALLVGGGVSVLGAIWPALTAARMQPVAAMRVEA